MACSREMPRNCREPLSQRRLWPIIKEGRMETPVTRVDGSRFPLSVGNDEMCHLCVELMCSCDRKLIRCSSQDSTNCAIAQQTGVLHMRLC